MNTKSKEYNLIKILLAFNEKMTVSECARRVREIRSRCGLAS